MDGYDITHPGRTKEETRIAQYLRHIFGDRMPGIHEIFANILGVYRVIVNHANDAPNRLQRLLTEGGKPLFTLEQIKQIQRVVGTQLNTPYVRRLRGMKGGGPAPAPATPTTATPAKPTTTATPVDASRDKLWDKLIRTKIVAPIATQIPACWAQYDWIPFALYYIEQEKVIGPLLSTLLDSVSLSLPVLASLASQAISTLVALAPVPYASFVGDAVGYIVAVMLILMAVSINVSRKHFGSAFQVSLEAIPFLGEVLSDGAQKFELGAERYLVNRNKITKSIEEFSPTGARAITYYTPGWDAYTGKPPSVCIDEITKDVATYIAKQLPAPPATAATALPSLPNVKAPGLPTLPKAKAPALPTLPKAKGGRRTVRRSRRASKRKNTRRK
jgi:hypothetical protein